MIKKIELIEKIQDILNGGDQSADQVSRFHNEIISLNISEVYENMLLTMYKQSVQGIGGAGMGFLDIYTKPFPNTKITFDEDRCAYYIDTPVKYVQLPQNKGVRWISPMDESSPPFYALDNNANWVLGSLEVGLMNTVPTYYVENDRVYIQLKEAKYKEVMYKIVPVFDNLTDDDLIKEPSIVTKNGLLTITDVVVARLLNKPQQDITNDGDAQKPVR